MTNINDIANMTFDDVPMNFDVPDAEYLAEVSRATVAGSEDFDKYWVEVQLRPKEVLSEGVMFGKEDNLQPLTNEALVDAYPIKDKLYYHTSGCKKITRDNVAKVLKQDDVTGVSMKVLAEAMIGETVRVVTAQSAPNKNGRVYVNVERYLQA
jgi:hypothetical protein